MLLNVFSTFHGKPQFFGAPNICAKDVCMYVHNNFVCNLLLGSVYQTLQGELVSCDFVQYVHS